MAPYTSLEAVRALVARAAPSRPGTAAGIDDSRVLDAIESAQDKIDANLGQLYTVPFNPPPRLIRDIATAFAAYDLDLTFREVRDYSSELNPILLRHKEASQTLRDLRDGKTAIPGYEPPEGSPDPEDGDPGSVVAVFNPEILPLPCTTSPDWMDRYYGWTL